MAQLIVRNLEDDVKKKLQERAKRHGRSTEEEVREILRSAVVNRQAIKPLSERIAARFKKSGGLSAEIDSTIEELRGQPVRPVDFDK